MLEVVATTPSKPFSVCVVVDMGLTQILGSLLPGARRDQTRGRNSLLYANFANFPTRPGQPEVTVQTEIAGLNEVARPKISRQAVRLSAFQLVHPKVTEPCRDWRSTSNSRLQSESCGWGAC